MVKFIDINIAADFFFDGMTIMVGGFGGQGVPSKLISAVVNSGKKNITIISNDLGADGSGVGFLLPGGMAKKIICSYVGESKSIQNFNFDIKPQGILIEKIKAGASNIKAIIVESFGREIYERSLYADVALIKTDQVDRFGNLFFLGSSKNFNMAMSKSAKKVFVEADKIRRTPIPPHIIHVPGLFVDYVVS